MRTCDLKGVGQELFHNTDLTLGQGVVTRIDKHRMENCAHQAGRYSSTVWVKFPTRTKPMACRPHDLRRIPHPRARVDLELHHLRQRGIEARYDGTKIVFAETKPKRSKRDLPPILANIVPMWEMKFVGDRLKDSEADKAFA